jgi:hypothetical protein
VQCNYPTSLIRLIATDGFNTTIAVSPAFTVYCRAPAAHITTPRDGAVFVHSEEIMLRGRASDPEEGTLPGTGLTWTVPPFGIVGAGPELALPGLPPGIYDVVLSASDQQGLTGSAQVQIEVVAARLAGDSDKDGDVDLDDLSQLVDPCLAGPNVTRVEGCEPFDIDQDWDVDLKDFAAVQRAFTGGPPPVVTLAQLPDQDELWDSDLDPDPIYGMQLMADNFVASQPMTISALRWWGGYSYATEFPSTDDFTIRIFENTDSLPGTLLWENHPGDNVARTATGRIVTSLAGDLPEFAYQAWFSSPFSPEPGHMYWLVICDDTAGSPTTWGWETSHAGDLQLCVRHDEGPWHFHTSSYDLAFELLE